jgi:hypothetical protein
MFARDPGLSDLHVTGARLEDAFLSLVRNGEPRKEA